MVSQPPPAATATAHAFNKILRESKPSSKSRGSSETDDGTKKLRRLILIEGIPASVVSVPSSLYRVSLTADDRQDPTLRPRIWKILLGTFELPVESYLRYVTRGPCQ